MRNKQQIEKFIIGVLCMGIFAVHVLIVYTIGFITIISYVLK